MKNTDAALAQGRQMTDGCRRQRVALHVDRVADAKAAIVEQRLDVAYPVVGEVQVAQNGEVGERSDIADEVVVQVEDA